MFSFFKFGLHFVVIIDICPLPLLLPPGNCLYPCLCSNIGYFGTDHLRSPFNQSDLPQNDIFHPPPLSSSAPTNSFRCAIVVVNCDVTSPISLRALIVLFLRSPSVMIVFGGGFWPVGGSAIAPFLSKSFFWRQHNIDFRAQYYPTAQHLRHRWIPFFGFLHKRNKNRFPKSNTFFVKIVFISELKIRCETKSYYIRFVYICD